MHEEVDALYDVAPEEFVTARDELAKRLRAEGESEQAAAVKKLRKPTVTQWIEGQVRRHYADDVDALRTALRRLGDAQETAVTGGGRDALHDATGRHREAVEALGRTVDQVLARSGRPAHHRDEVLSAIESDLVSEVASGTFGLRDDLELPDRSSREPGRDRAAERQAAEAEAAIERAEARVTRARAELTNAEAELDALRARHARAASD